MTVYNKKISSQCNLTPQIEPVQDNTYSLQITNINFYGNQIDCSYS